MATAVAQPRGTRITKEVTITHDVGNTGAEEERRRWYRETDFWEVIGQVMGKPGHMVRVYRADDNWKTASSPADNKLTEPFDENTIFQKWGGGRYILWLYENASVMRSPYQLEIEGVPRVNNMAAPNTVMGPTVDGQTAVSLEALRMASNPEVMRTMMSLFLEASKQSMEMLRAQMPQQQNPLELLRAAKDLFAPSGPPVAPAADPFRDFITAAMPKLLERLLTPGDPLDSIKSVGAILDATKAFTGQNVKADWSSTLLAQLPALGDKVISGFKEWRLGTESNERMIRIQNHLPPTDARVINVDDTPPQPAAATPNPPAPLAAPQQPETQIAQPGTMPWFLLNLERFICTPASTGADIYEFVASCHGAFLMPEDVFQILTKDKETVVLALRQWFTETFGPDNEHLKRVVADPQRLMSVIDEYMAAVEADRGETPPVPPAKPN